VNPLDRPIWTALSTRQAEFAQGQSGALRYRASVEPFAAAGVDDERSLETLATLAAPGETLLLIQTQPSPVPPGLELVSEAVGVQMVAIRGIEGEKPADAMPMGDADVREMIALAELTKPGPFRAETHKLGQFWGVRRDGRLIAMAGERMKIPGMSEVSGVCTHPDWRGHGFARTLSAFVANQIQQRGEIPFLHAYADNAAAIRLYEELGFVHRSNMAVQALALAPDREKQS
jgi:ribosomal protein S18 acetylase RimI-like enzyme